MSVLVVAVWTAACDDQSAPPTVPPDEQATFVKPHPMNLNPPAISRSMVLSEVGTAAVDPPAVISNGTVRLGVNPAGHLNVIDPGLGGVGLQFVPTGNESTFPGCLCEGWGVGDATSGTWGGANEATVLGGTTANLTVESFEATTTEATSIVTVADIFRVTHQYHPSPRTANLYEVTVNIRNISDATVDVRYRRLMDWDVEPTAFSEFVTIQGTAGAEAIEYANDNGFEQPNPLLPNTPLLFSGDAVDNGPADHGANFNFDFGELAPGEDTTFTTFYGGAATEEAALEALGRVGTEIYSFGQPNTPDGPTLGTPNTFIFAFAGVGGEIVVPPPPNEAPEAEILEPEDGATFDEGEAITFTGEATDAEDGDLTGGALVWTAPGIGEIGVGESFTRSDLPVGTHTVVLTATDSEGVTGTDRITITIEGEPGEGPECGGFCFLPPTPTVTATPSPSGPFDGSFNPTVLVCEAADGGCGRYIAGFLRSPIVAPPARITVDEAAEEYQITWNASRVSIDPAKTYRIIVFTPGTTLGSLEVSGGMLTGRVPIRFRIEE